MKKLFLVGLLFLLPFCVLAADHTVSEAKLAAHKKLSNTNADALKESLQKDMQAQKASIDTDILVLRTQNDLIQSYQSSILSTVYWALGVALSLAFFLAGYGWWTNHKLFEVEKERIQDQLNSKINELETKLALRLETNRSELEKAVDAKGEAQLSRLLSEMGEVRSNISDLNTGANSLSEKLRKSSELFVKRIGETDSKIVALAADLEVELRFVEEYVWEARGVPANILRAQCSGIEQALINKSIPYINMTLLRMKSTIQNYFLDKAGSIEKSQYDEIYTLLTNIGKTKGVQVGEIFEALGKLKVA